MLLDTKFAYKHNLRFLLINKLGNIKNTYNIPEISKIYIYFNLNKLEDLDDIQLYNKLYLLKFFLGKNAYFSKTKKNYSLGIWYYSINVQLIIDKSISIYILLNTIFNNIYVNIDKNLLRSGLLNRKLNIFYLLIKDLNIYSELKTNMALFNIKKPLNIRLYLKGFNYKNILLSNLKYI